MSFTVIQGVLAAAVANGATFTAAYPAGLSAGNFVMGVDHKLIVGQASLEQPKDFTIAFGATQITVTNTTGSAFPAGAAFFLQLDQAGSHNRVQLKGIDLYRPGALALIDLGSPVAASSNAICLSQAINTGTPGLINGAIGANLGLTGRNVVAAWTGAAVLTITGTDVHGNKVIESSSSGTSFTGKKAFKTVTSVTVSSNVTACTVGTGDVLGLPVRLPSTAMILKELEDGAAAVAGTAVAGLSVNTPATATTADPRGTYDPNSACDGAKGFALLVALLDPVNIGEAQFAG